MTKRKRKGQVSDTERDAYHQAEPPPEPPLAVVYHDEPCGRTDTERAPGCRIHAEADAAGLTAEEHVSTIPLALPDLPPEPDRGAPPPAAPPPVKLGVYLYNPDDEPDSGLFSGRQVVLAPNRTTLILPMAASTAATVADHLVSIMGRYGICRTAGPVVDGVAELAADQPIVDRAERVYLEATRAWAERQLAGWFLHEKPRRDAGLPERVEPDHVHKARRWLKTYEEKLRAAGLVA